jgi:hypothetical protein
MAPEGSKLKFSKLGPTTKMALQDYSFDVFHLEIQTFPYQMHKQHEESDCNSIISNYKEINCLLHNFGFYMMYYCS